MFSAEIFIFLSKVGHFHFLNDIKCIVDTQIAYLQL